MNEQSIEKYSENLDVKNYTDEELLEHINLEEPYTETELMEKLTIITNMFGSSSGDTVENFLQFYNDVEERLKEKIAPEDDEEDKQDIPEIKISTIKKRHTLIINSDKRTDRKQSTTSFSWELEDEIPNVKSLSIESYNIPKSWYNISNAIGNNIFGISYIQPKTLNFTVTNAADLNTSFNAKSPIDISDETFDTQMNRNICTESLGAGLLRDSDGKPKTEFGDYWSDISWNVTYNDNNDNKFDISTNPNDTTNLLDISYIPMTPGTKYDYILIRDISASDGANVPITTTNMRELSEKNMYFLIRQYGLTQESDTSAAIVTFLNNRSPIDFSAVNTDIYTRANLDVTNTQDYNAFIYSIEQNVESYEPSNKIKEKTYDIWASFKDVDFKGSDNLNITTNLLETEIQELYTDISDISWNIADNGISSVINTTEGALYDLTCVKTDSQNIRVDFIPKNNSKRLERKLYFRIKEGHYGSVNSLLGAINEIAPKKHYDNRDISGSISLKNFLIDMPMGNGDSTYDFINKAYNNNFGTSVVNTIDWNLTRDPQTEHIVLSSLTGNTTADVSFIFYDSNFNEIFNGVTTCGGARAGLFNINNTLGKILGYITDSSVSDYIITPSLNNTGTNSPDLRRVRNVNIMLVDYKAYAYVPNSNQINPAPKNKAIKTPFYFSEVVVDEVCEGTNEASEIVVNQIEALSGNGRNLTEKQIYSLNAIFESQDKVQESNGKQLNYMYKDYFLYGIHVRDKPELGTSSNEGILSSYDSKKGKREYIDPTRLTKFYIELVDQNFNIIDLNGIDVELTLNIETEVSIKK
jgi:hypothetical protein